MARKQDTDLLILGNLIERVFAGSRCHFARTETGVSTEVYRIWHDDEIFYLRLAEEPASSLLPEVQVHTMLHERGVKVPQVVYFDPFDQDAGRSVMVTTQIRGEHIGHCRIDTTLAEILREAGRDLAIINSIPITGFGWIRRDQSHAAGFQAEHATLESYVSEHLVADLALLGTEVLTTGETTMAHTLIDQVMFMGPAGQAWLAHGDLDVTHIYQEHGRYTGIIDFGEIRGGGRFYDLGHFNLYDGERLRGPVLHFLLEGYGEIAPLAPDHAWHIQVWSLLIGIRALARSMSHPPGEYQRYLARSVVALIGVLTSG